jgi:hypothetical protein
MNVTRLTLTETPAGWTSDTGLTWPTAAEAEREIRETASAGVTIIQWQPKTRIGRMVAAAVAATR